MTKPLKRYTVVISVRYDVFATTRKEAKFIAMESHRDKEFYLKCSNSHYMEAKHEECEECIEEKP
jgi:quinol monooxygenase YgiN